MTNDVEREIESKPRRILSIHDDITNLKIYEIINAFFGEHYTGYMKAWYPVNEEYGAWFPKVAFEDYSPSGSYGGTKKYTNSISEDGTVIYEHNHEASPDEDDVSPAYKKLRFVFARIDSKFHFVGIFHSVPFKGTLHAVHKFERIATAIDLDTFEYIEENEVEIPDDYNPGITKEKWFELLNDSSVTYQENLRMFQMMLQLGGESTCTNLAVKFGGTYGTYNTLGTQFADRVHKKTNCPLFMDHGKERLYPIVFKGHYIIEEGKKRYSWILREELKEALEDMNLPSIPMKESPTSTIEYDRNMILYGPPGTGKTYNSVIYAVAICEGKPVEEYTDYHAVMEKYEALKKEGRIAFTTFHQSYGYEEFIEGISPVITADENSNDNNDITYKYKDGCFKAFCEAARKRTVQSSHNVNIADNATVWNIILGGPSDPELKQKCFDENDSCIRIGWSKAPEIVNDQTEDLSIEARRMIMNFQDYMEIGDVVLTQSSNHSIDAIGVITGNYEYDPQGNDKYPRKRSVQWLVKGIKENIVSINDGMKLARKSIYPLDRISLNSVLDLVAKNATSEVQVCAETRPYVFVIDEINRGNISKIFGELITLIEDSKRAGMLEEASALLPYSGQEFSVPKNVYILGTMNTADRSISLMDTALRRRFQFVEMMPDTNVLNGIVVKDGSETLNVAKMLEVINERIKFLYDREHTIGHAFFIGLKETPTVDKLASIFQKSIIPLLQEYFYEDYQKIQLVLGDTGKKDEDGNIKFIKDTKVIAKDIFVGNIDEVIDLPEKKYEVNPEALYNILSYKKIAPGL